MNPILNLSSLFDAIAPESLFWWFSRMTLLAALACAFLVCAYRLRPAVRHAVAVGSLFAIALLPIASALLPAWSIPVLPAPTVRIMEKPGAPVLAIDAAPLPAAAAMPAVRSTEPATGSTLPMTVGRVTSRVRDTLVSSIGWKGAVLVLWFNVMAALLLRIAMGTLSARRFALGAPITTDETILRECARARRLLGIDRDVDVIVTRHVTVPLVACALRPCIMLPGAATRWSRERLATVLLHELAHVRRRDNVWVTLARIVCAVFWFHPLVWILAAQLRRDAESACDDVVLASGVRNSDYAEHLVAIARTTASRDVFSGAALSLATRSSLERRVVSILKTRTPRAAMSRRALASLACVSVVFLLAIAAAQPTPVVSAQLMPLEKFELLNASGDDETLHALTPDEMEPYTVHAAGMGDENAIELAQKDSGNDRASGREYYSDATELYNRRRYARAAEGYMKAAEFGYKRPTALYNAGCSYALAEAPDDAIEALRAAFEEGFDRPDLFAADEDLNSLRGDARFQKLFAEVMNSDAAQLERRSATREYDRLVKRDNVEEGEWNSVGIDLLRAGDYERSAEAFDREFKVSGDEGALYNKACARSLAGNSAEALTLLEQSIKTGSVDANHMAEDADLIPLHGQKRFTELVALAEDLELHAGDGRDDWKFWHKNRKVDEGKYWSRALPRLEKVTKDHPDIGRAWFNLGYAQLLAEQPEKGAASFQKALDLGYQKPTTMYNLACCAAQSEDADAAFAWLDRADEAGFDNWGLAHDDDDLDPIRSDPRFDKIEDRWKSEMSYKHKHKVKYDYHYEHDDDEQEDRDYD